MSRPEKVEVIVEPTLVNGALEERYYLAVYWPEANGRACRYPSNGPGFIHESEAGKFAEWLVGNGEPEVRMVYRSADDGRGA